MSSTNIRGMFYPGSRSSLLTMGKMYQMCRFELLAAMQACMIYLIIYMIDYSSEDLENVRELLLALNAGPHILFIEYS